MPLDKVCLACEKRRPRTLKPRIDYRYAKTGTVFCSLTCAASYGLLAANGMATGIATWCREHGWQSVEEGEPDCFYCEHDISPTDEA